MNDPTRFDSSDDDDDEDSGLYNSMPSTSVSQESDSNNPNSEENEDLSKTIKASHGSCYYEEKGCFNQAINISPGITCRRRRSKRKRATDFSQAYHAFPSTPRKLFKGESSNSKPKTKAIITKSQRSENRNVDQDAIFFCCGCVDVKPKIELFRIKGCPHSHCSDCISNHLASTLRDNIANIKCPVLKCEGKLEPENCRSILPPQVFDRWSDALYEALMLSSENFCCPYKDCSAALLMDDGEVISKAKCPCCWRLFCAQCRVPWHSEMSCKEFMLFDKEG